MEFSDGNYEFMIVTVFENSTKLRFLTKFGYYPHVHNETRFANMYLMNLQNANVVDSAPEKWVIVKVVPVVWMDYLLVSLVEMRQLFNFQWN